MLEHCGKFLSGFPWALSISGFTVMHEMFTCMKISWMLQLCKGNVHARKYFPSYRSLMRSKSVETLWQISQWFSLPSVSGFTVVHKMFVCMKISWISRGNVHARKFFPSYRPLMRSVIFAKVLCYQKWASFQIAKVLCCENFMFYNILDWAPVSSDHEVPQRAAPVARLVHSA